MKNEQGSDETERKSARAVKVCHWTLFIFSGLVLSTDHFLQDSKKNQRTACSHSLKGPGYEVLIAYTTCLSSEFSL